MQIQAVTTLRHGRTVGVDVGGRRKGFDVAVLDDREVAALMRGLDREAVVELVSVRQPALVAVDSPRSCAPARPSSGAAPIRRASTRLG